VLCMILVPNPQLPLSGSKVMRLFVLLVFLMTLKVAGAHFIVSDIYLSGHATHVIDDSFFRSNDSLHKIQFRGREFLVPPHKKSFKITVLLPFHTDFSNSPVDKKRANVMLEYYQGMKMAIKCIDSLDSKFVISFHDTDNDTNQLKSILASTDVKRADIIIGPTSKRQVEIASNFCKKNRTPLFLPITNSVGSEHNPYIFDLNPPDALKAREFLAYYKNHQRNKRLVIVRDKGYFDRTFGKALVAECKQQQIPIKIVPYSTNTEWSKTLKGNSLVIHTTQDKIKLNYTVTGLQAYRDSIILVGSDKLLDFNDVDYNQWEKLNITFLSENKSQVANPYSNQMKVAYRMDYRDDPSWFSYMGYDHLLFACEILDAFGNYFPLFIEDKEITYSNTNFSMKRTDSTFQNQYLGIFKLVDGQLTIENIK